MWTFVMALAATTSLVAALEWQASRTTLAAALTYEEGAFAAAGQMAAELGGPLTADEMASIRRVSRRELAHAFAGLEIRLTDDPDAFWRVRVVSSATARSFNTRARVSAAGTSFGFGPLGGVAFLDFDTLALNAVRHAPVGASRQLILEGIGRGVGRAAAHEFAHLIVQGPIDTRRDTNSYEYYSADRASQYYGELRWAHAWPALQSKIGK